MARSLVATVSQLNLSTAQYQTAWQKLFSGLLPNTPTTDPHAGTPTIGTPNGANNVASVAFLSNSAKTDRAMRIRVTAGAGAISAATDVVTITFASEWKDSNGNPIVPAIVGSQGAYASACSSTGFTLQLANQINAGNFQDFAIIISGGGSGNTNS